MKTLSTCLVIILLCLNSTFSQKAANNTYTTTTESNSNIDFRSKVLRSQTETYVDLVWNPDICPQGCELVVQKVGSKDSKTIISKINTARIQKLDNFSEYRWKILTTQDEESPQTDWNYFSTEYTSPIVATKDIRNALRKWNGANDKFHSIEEFMRAQKHIHPELIETFIMDFYEGNPPSLSRMPTDDCNCRFVVGDSKRRNSVESEDLNFHWQHPTTDCRWWTRFDSHEIQNGAAKDLELNLNARLYKSEKENYSIANHAGMTALSIQYKCDSNECCDADFNFGGFYESEVYVKGDLPNRGEYLLNSADVGFFTIFRDGVPTRISDPSATAIFEEEERDDNPRFFELIIPNIFSTDNIFNSFLLDSTSVDTAYIDNLINDVIELISTTPIVQTYDSNGNNFEGTSYVSKQPFPISPNENVEFVLTSNSLVEYSNVWGRKRWTCEQGQVNTENYVRTGYSMAVSFFDTNDDDCCIDDYAKWVTDSYIGEGSGHLNQMLGYAGNVVECNNDEWTYNGQPAMCDDDNPVLPAAAGVFKKVNDCCPDEVDSGFSVSYQCLNQKPIEDCIDCSAILVEFSADDCDTDAIRSLVVDAIDIESGESTNVPIENTTGNCDFAFIMPIEDCKLYRFTYTVETECDTGISQEFPFSSCCKDPVIGDDGKGDSSDGGSGDADEEVPPQTGEGGYITLDVSDSQFISEIPESNSRAAERKDSKEFKIYPIPATDFMKIKTAEAGVLKLYSVSGTLVMTKNILANEITTLQSSEIGTGVFVVQLHTESGITSKKIIIQ